jgi:hypothetical protein
MAVVKIDVAAEFTGAKAFKQAETATEKMSKNVKNLGRTLGVTFSATAVLAYAKKSIKAAAEDQAAQASLGQTLKNLGFENKATADSVNGFISNLERQTGVLDDELRPAMDRLLRATGSVTKSQELMGLALDISAGTGKNLGQVTQSLQKAFLGQTQALGRLGVGLSKAELSSSNFEEITARLTVLFAGQAQRQADSFKGSIDKLAVASNNAAEIIGQGLIDALKNLGDSKDIEKLSTDMESTAESIADAVRGLGVMIGYIQKIYSFGDDIPFLMKIRDFVVNLNAIASAFNALKKWGEASEQAANATADSAQALAHLAELESKYSTKTLANSKKITAEESKQLKAKQLQLAIDKANLALDKGDDVFNMEKIQLAAAEKNAAEQLGKVTSQAQLLQITNDLARLEVKQSILDLEDAIASKDVAAITNATNKLNADLKVLGALNGQKVKLTEIEDILKAMLPKDLINIANLDEAIAKLKFIGGGSTTTAAMSGTGTGAATPTLLESLAAGSFVPVTGGGYSSTAGNYASSGFPGADKNGGVTVVVNAGTIANPEELTTMIQNAVISLNKRGDLLTTAGAL